MQPKSAIENKQNQNSLRVTIAVFRKIDALFSIFGLGFCRDRVLDQSGQKKLAKVTPALS